MHGFPSDFDPNVFVGLRLSSVTYAENVIGLEFDPDALISVLGSVTYGASDKEDPVTDSPPVDRTELVKLLGRSVTAGSLQSKRELRLQLDGGGFITLLDDSEQYESFVIRISGTEIYV